MMRVALLFACVSLCVGQSPPRVLAPWEGPEREAWLAEYQARFGREFKTDPTVTSTTVWPTPVSMSHPDTPVAISPRNFKCSISPNLLSPRRSTGSELDVLSRAIDRYHGIMFIWGNGSLPEGAVDACEINVLQPNAQLNSATNEGYNLTITDSSVTISAVSTYGALHALDTLSQLVAYNLTSDTYTIAPTNITDYPRFEFRGAMIDVSRNYMSLSALREMVEVMPAMKLNTLHLHLSDDQSWPMESAVLPLLAKWGAFSNVSHSYSLTDMRDFVQFARDRGVRVIPEFDLPSHSSKMCYAYPDMCAHWHTSGNTTLVQLFDPSSEVAWDRLTSLIAEMTTVFIDDEWHIGSDEVWGVPWENSTSVQAWMHAHTDACPDKRGDGCGTTSKMHYYMTRRLLDLLATYGKRGIGWAPGVDGFSTNSTGDNDYRAYGSFTLDTWSGFSPPGTQYWQESMARNTAQYGRVILSGPYYVIDRWPHQNDGNRFSWHDMYHTDPQNFTGSPEQMDLVRGGKLCVWDDAARTDSGNLLSKTGIFLAALGESLWSINGTVVPKDWPTDHYTGLRYSDHRCRLLRRGLRFEPIESFAIPCPVEFQTEFIV